ncbi:MAG: NAD-binding protein, partial [Candidatus Korarchaeota archaeon]|nr:NAD-binding protein [Candidatus Korarchaeota archaeon]
MDRLRLAIRVVLAYSRALRTTLAFVGLMVLVAAISAYAGGETLRGVFELAEEIRAPRSPHEWLIWVSFFSLRIVPVLGFVEVASLDRETRTEIRVRAMEGHAVVVGLGHLGRRVARELRRAGMVVGALVRPSDRERSGAVEELGGIGVRVVSGDATTGQALQRA